MERRNFIPLEREVSVIGFGAGQIGGPDYSEDEAARLLNQVLDLGINLIDTARGYGLSEERIGRHLSGRRAEYILSTKVGYLVEGYSDWTYDCVRAGVDQALDRLQTDHIDIVHLHSCSRDILEHNGVIEALEQARQAGKIGLLAYSGENEDLDWALDSGRFQSYMASLNICDQRLLDNALPRMQMEGRGFIAKRPIANACWRFAERPTGDYAEEYWHRWQTMALDTGMNPLELALRWALYTPGVQCAIIGTRSLDHLRSNLKLMEKGPLPPALWQQVRAAFQTHDQDWTGQI